LALDSEKIALELTTVLEGLRIDGIPSRWKSIVQGIRSVWNLKKIQDTKGRLDVIHKALQFRIQVLMREDQISIRDDILQSLDDVTRQVLVAVLMGKDEIAKQQELSVKLAAQRDEVVELISNKWVGFTEPQDVLNRIQSQLRHQRQDDRFDDIVPAHENTFRWALENTAPDLSEPSLYDWLQEGNGVYWISGKAGSGKSTLMKLLHQDAGLRNALGTWAENSRLIIASFYFWNAGSSLQKSQEGLFRSILYQVLEQEPSLSQTLFPEQHLPGPNWTGFPTVQELRRALSRFTTSLDCSIKVAMLIDGLDEFDAINLTMTELAEMFLNMTRSDNIKALLSSRPLAPFEFMFQHQPKLRLHDLTHKDITTYVNDKLATHPQVEVLSKDDPDGVYDLIDDIVNSAAGVFLWVKLVVRSLLDGLQNYDRLSNLQQRLRELPPDLEDFFRHMLRSVPSKYKVESSRIFQIMRSYDRNTSILHHSRLTVFALHLTDTDDATVLRTRIAEASDTDRKRYEVDTEGRLRSRCAGLLVVRAYKEKDPLHVLSVEYLHKSVADFFARQDVWSEILSYTGKTAFDPNMALLRSSIVQVKCAVPDLGPESRLWYTVEDAMTYAKLVESTSEVASPILLEELDRCMHVHFQNNRNSISKERYVHLAGGVITSWYECGASNEVRDRKESWNENFLAFSVQRGLVLYAQAKLNKLGKIGSQKGGKPLLEHACVPVPAYGKHDRHRNFRPELIALLLHHGADPNERWGYSQESVFYHALVADLGDPFKWILVLSHLIFYGGKPEIDVISTNGASVSKEKVTIRKSALRYAMYRIERILKGAPGEWHRFWSSGYNNWRKHIPPHILVELSSAVDELIQLLIDKGAKEEEWYRIEDRTDAQFMQVYPEDSTITTDIANQTDLTTSTFTMTPKRPEKVSSKIKDSVRSPFRRLKHRIDQIRYT
jgi:hypothetical protein